MKTTKLIIYGYSIALLLYSCKPVSEDRNTKEVTLSNGVSFFYNTKANKITSFKDWSEFKELNEKIAIVEKNESSGTIDQINELNILIYNLDSSIPNYLKTKKVEQSIDELKDTYKELKAEKEKSKKVVSHNCEKLVEQFNKFKMVLKDTISHIN